MAIRAPERGSFSLFRRLSENPASSGTQLTRFARAFGAAALLAVAAGCGSAGYEPNGRRIGDSDVVSPDGAVGPGGDGHDAGNSADAGDSGDGDAGGGPDAGGAPDAGPLPDAGQDAGPDAGPDGGTPPICPAETCREGIGACEQVGRVLYDPDCIPTGCSVSGGEPAAAEDCGNALDDDCNGEVNNGCACAPDETTACYTGGEDTRNRGACHDGNSTCNADGRWGSCEGQQTPLEEEICGNGLNEDCDLETDEGCGGGVECFAGEGICRTAGVTRADGSCDAVPAVPEETDLCGDGLDNDCVNGIDDGCVCPAESTQLCYQGGEDTLNIGVCRPGTQACIDDGRRWSPVCDGQVLPSAEQCNGEDDNCNRETDENLTRPCFTDCGGGIEVCRDGSFQDCNAPQPRPETCNGADDNCNDRIDEDIAPRACSTICGNGTEVCRDGAFRDCNAPTPQEEVCNGTDDDCSGVTDESCPCTEGRGICERDGVIQPDGNCSAVPGEPGIEICNGADDNCNGETDETFPDQGQPCTVGRGACERTGEVVCEPPLGAHCNVLPGTPRDEECNAADDDCDGVTDEDCPCTNGLGICERPGTIQPDGVCDAVAGDPDPAGETCNTLDDDCNGETDDGLTRPCSTECGAGDDLCIDGGYVCNAPTPQPETCNGADDNCNTLTDEENALGCTTRYLDHDVDGYGTPAGRCICGPEGEFTALVSGDCVDDNADINPGEPENTSNRIDDNCNRWTDESAGLDAMCEPGVSMDLFGAGGPDCLGQELHQFFPGGTSRMVMTAGYEDPPGDYAHATLVTLAPADSPAYTNVRAVHRAAPWGFAPNPVGIRNICPPDLPLPPPDKEVRCFQAPRSGDSPDIPGSTVEFFIDP